MRSNTKHKFDCFKGQRVGRMLNQNKLLGVHGVIPLGLLIEATYTY
jgi:hypothetical protein